MQDESATTAKRSSKNLYAFIISLFSGAHPPKSFPEIVHAARKAKQIGPEVGDRRVARKLDEAVARGDLSLTSDKRYFKPKY